MKFTFLKIIKNDITVLHSPLIFAMLNAFVLFTVSCGGGGEGQYSIVVSSPVVSELPATLNSVRSATLNGMVNPNGLATTVWFEWGTDPNLSTYSSTPSQAVGGGTADLPLSAALSGLGYGTTYYFRMAATNSAGGQRGTILSFSTSALAPTVGTNAATSITTASAILNGMVNPNGLATTAWFEWGTDPNLSTYSSTPSQAVGSGTADLPVSAALSGLNSWIPYFYRLVASNNGGTQKGNIKNFTTGDYYVCIGDSITEGYGDDYSPDDVSLDGRNSGGGYEPILNNQLTLARGYPQNIVNEAIGGTTSADGAISIFNILINNPLAKHVLVQYGTNDAWIPIPSGRGLNQGDQGYDGSYKYYMQQIISTIIDAGKVPFLAQVPFTLNSNLIDIIQEYNLVIEELVAFNNIPVNPPDFYSYFMTHQGEFSDSLHPNGVGYQSMASLWFNALSN